MLQLEWEGQHPCPVTLAEPRVSCEKWASLSFTTHFYSPTPDHCSGMSPQILLQGILTLHPNVVFHPQTLLRSLATNVLLPLVVS